MQAETIQLACWVHSRVWIYSGVLSHHAGLLQHPRSVGSTDVFGKSIRTAIGSSSLNDKQCLVVIARNSEDITFVWPASDVHFEIVDIDADSTATDRLIVYSTETTVTSGDFRSVSSGSRVVVAIDVGRLPCKNPSEIGLDRLLAAANNRKSFAWFRCQHTAMRSTSPAWDSALGKISIGRGMTLSGQKI